MKKPDLRKSVATVSAVLLVGIALAGCSGGGDENGSADSGSANKATAAESSTDGAGAEDSDGNASSGGAARESSPGSSGSGTDKDLCSFFSAIGEDTSRISDPNQAQKVAMLTKLNRDARNVTAPAAISADWEVMRNTFKQMLDIAKSIPTDDPSASQKMADASKTLDRDAYDKAGRSIQAWADTNCK